MKLKFKSKISNQSDDSDLVYTSDDKGGKRVSVKKSKNNTFDKILPEQTKIKIRLEKKSRGGKEVLVLFDLPHNPPFFKKLLKEIKKELGCGGTVKEDTVEIQSSDIDRLKTLLKNKKFMV